MANHVIRDRIWKSKKLRRCSREAAMAYPWIFLVADDWGRFEFDPRLIWSQAFAAREDVTVEEVATWLSEFEREKLLIRYNSSARQARCDLNHSLNHENDFDLAYWTKFEGRPPSKRRPSQYPEPKEVKRKEKRKGNGTGEVPDRYPTGSREKESRSGEQSRAENRHVEQGAEGGHVPADAGGSVSSDSIAVVHQHWQEAMGHPKAKLSPKRRQRVRDRFKDGFTVYELCEAVDGCKRSAFHMGANDRGVRFDDLELICRDIEHVEKFRALIGAPPARAAPQGRMSVGETAMAEAAKFLEFKGGGK